MTTILLGRICRTCLLESSTMHKLLDSKRNTIQIEEMLNMTVPNIDLVMDEDTPLPVEICSECLDKLLASYSFQQMCLASNERLRNFFTHPEMKDMDLSGIDMNKALGQLHDNCENDNNLQEVFKIEVNDELMTVVSFGEENILETVKEEPTPNVGCLQDTFKEARLKEEPVQFVTNDNNEFANDVNEMDYDPGDVYCPSNDEDNSERFLTLTEIINALEESDEEIFQNSYDISIVPTQGANDYVTDEDSGEEDEVNFENLPPLLLNAEAELFRNSYATDSDSEDDVPYIKSSVKWVKHDLEETEPIVTACEQEILPTPLELFKKLFDGDLLQVITQFSNDYASKQNATANITPDEIRCFIGILLLSGYNTVSRRRMYWQNDSDTHHSPVSSAMRRDRFEFIIRNLHFVDNNSLNKTDKFAKVRPLLLMLNKSFQSNAPKTIQHSVDEQMVPYYGRHGKPIRYGYKFWVGATYNGYIIWFEPYQGAGTFPNNTYKEMGLGPSVVLTYCDILSQSQPDISHRLYFDNLFTTINLLAELEERRVKGTGRIRHNRLGNCTLPKKKDLQKREKGWYDYRKISTNNIIVCCWNDTSAVNVASNVHPVEPSKNISRWSRKEKKHIYIPQPRLIHEYNRYMGGVDRAEENISLYRVSIRGKKWYFPIFTHLIDLAEHNAWQLHRHMGGKMDHLSFRRRIATLLISTYGKPSATLPSGSSCDIRFDRKDHLLTENTRQADGKCKQLRCKHCHKKTTTRCIKCDVPLHVKCNVEYHTTK